MPKSIRQPLFDDFMFHISLCIYVCWLPLFFTINSHYLAKLTCVLVLTLPPRCRGVTTPHLLPPSWIRAHAWMQYQKPPTLSCHMTLVPLSWHHLGKRAPGPRLAAQPPRASSCGPVLTCNKNEHNNQHSLTIYLTCYPSWQLHKRQASDPQLTTHPTLASCGGPVLAHPQGGAVINCNENKTQQPNTQHNLHNHN